MEIASMSDEEADEFLDEFHIEESALDRMIKSSYKILNLISFFTVGDDEVKAWTINKGTPALEAQRGSGIRIEKPDCQHQSIAATSPGALHGGVRH